MKKFFKEVSWYAVEIIVAISCIWLLYNVENDTGEKGVMNIVGANVKYTSVNYDDAVDQKTIEHLAERNYPEIKALITRYSEKTEYKLSDCFVATDENGNNLKINIVELTYMDGSDASSMYDSSTEHIQFYYPGTYTFKLNTKDAEQLSTCVQIKVTVN